MSAYLVAGLLYRRAIAHESLRPPLQDNLLILGLALLGALIGSKLIHVFEHLPALLAARDPLLWLGGKSVMGAFLGGTLGVEAGKKVAHWRLSTGDLWVVPLAVGLMIGRVGCQLSGPEDLTYGIPTTRPWGWDYGDGIMRHPTALYEILWVGLSLLSTRLRIFQTHRGLAFAWFLLLYSAGRLVLEFFKPPFGQAIPGTLPVSTYLGLTAIQWAAIIGIIWFSILTRIRLQRESI